MNCFNGESYLHESVSSIINQSFKNWELIFWDNQSTDNSKEIFESFKDDRLKYFYAPNHTDLGKARKHAYSKVTGEFISVLDVDDIWYPKKLEKQIGYFADPKIGIVICNTRFFNDKKSKNLYSKLSPPEGWVFNQIFVNYFVSLETILIRKSFLDALPIQFDDEFNMISDFFDVIVRVCSISKLKYHPEVLSAWRIHDNNDSFKRPRVFLNERKNG